MLSKDINKVEAIVDDVVEAAIANTKNDSFNYLKDISDYGVLEVRDNLKSISLYDSKDKITTDDLDFEYGSALISNNYEYVEADEEMYDANHMFAIITFGDKDTVEKIHKHTKLSLVAHNGSVEMHDYLRSISDDEASLDSDRLITDRYNIDVELEDKITSIKIPLGIVTFSYGTLYSSIDEDNNLTAITFVLNVGEIETAEEVISKLLKYAESCSKEYPNPVVDIDSEEDKDLYLKLFKESLKKHGLKEV